MSTSVVVVGLIDTVFNQRQVDRLTEYVASDVVDHNQVIFAQPDGPDGLVEGVRMFLRAFPNFQAHVAETMVDS
jgi:predicted SnoaL-like aldol condensation-catalyzing enzyme